MEYTSKWGPLKERYETTQPRKILSLDGGGIRGILTLEILLQIETQLKMELQKDDSFRLADYFDYIGGTSTGAIIASGLAIGMSVKEIIDFYLSKGEAMFDKSFFLQVPQHRYDTGPLVAELKKTFGGAEADIDLQSGRFKTMLLVVTMNRSTDSPWPISNNPYAKYNDSNRQDCNLKIPLYQLVRASTAAPIYFEDEILEWDRNDPEKTFAFVDGGVTPYNNPAFLMYRMATQAPYKLNWKTGEKQLLIVSVGTGVSSKPGRYKNLIHTAKNIPHHLMYAMQVDQDINCRSVGRCIYGAPIDRELHDMIPLNSEGQMLPMDSDAGRHFSYVRYNADLSEQGLTDMNLPHINSEQIMEMSAVENLIELQAIGQIAGRKQVDVKTHFQYFLLGK